MSNQYNDAKFVTLGDFITPDKFRTILPEYRKLGGGVSEIPVEIHTKPPFTKSLSFNVGWDGMIYGFVRGKKDIAAKLGKIRDISKITVTDWDDRFLMVFEGKKDEEMPFFVSDDDVRELLETCLRVPEQYSVRKPKKK